LVAGGSLGNVGGEAPQGEARGNLNRAYLTQCINSMVLESQPPDKIVNMLFQLVTVNNKFTIFGGSCNSKTM
jgi:hypothetical protein